MRSQRRGSANRNGDPDFAELSSNPFARFSLGNGRLCLPSLTRSGLSAFAARSHMNQGAKNIIVGRSDEEMKTNLSFFASAKMYQSNR